MREGMADSGDTPKLGVREHADTIKPAANSERKRFMDRLQ